MAITKVRASRQILFDSYAMSGSSTIDMNSNKILNLQNPTGSQDAATKAYVDGVAQGLDIKESVRMATTASLALATDVEAGDSIDGVVLITGDRVLIKDQVSAVENGIYIVSASGTPGRSSDFNGSGSGGAEPEKVAGAFTFVEEGVLNADSGWVCTSTGSVVIGVDPINFTQFSGAGSITAGAGLSKVGNVLNVNVDDFSIEIVGDALQVKDGGITNDMLSGSISDDKLLQITTTNKVAGSAVQLAAVSAIEDSTGLRLTSSLAGDGLSMAAQVLSVNVDNVSLEILADTLQVKSGGISSDMLSGSIADNKLELNYLQVSEFVLNEIPSGSINGVNDEFTLVNTPSTASMMLYLNGVLQSQGVAEDYTVTGSTIIKFNASAIPETGDKVIATYLKGSVL